MDTLLVLLCLLPGFIIYYVLTIIWVGYGKDDDSLSKYFISLIFNFPVLTTFSILISFNRIRNIVFNSDQIIEITSVSDISNLLEFPIDAIRNIILLLIISTLFSLLFVLASKNVITYIYNNWVNIDNNYKIFGYDNIYQEYFVKAKESIPVEIYGLVENEIIDFGFINEISNSRMQDDIQISLIEKKLFTELKDKNLIELDKTYLDYKNQMKVLIYKEMEDS